jgi:hypothetical protein
MAQFKAFAPNVEVNGQTVLAIVAGMSWSQSEGLKILARHGIDEPQPELWYSQQAWLDSFSEIAETIGPHTLYQIGTKIPESAKFPPNIISLEQGLASINVAYHLNHRGGEIGSYQLLNVADNQATMVCHNPYPCDFDRGLIVATAQHFAPSGAAVNIQHDTSQGCRKLGAESCTYLIDWLLYKSRRGMTGTLKSQ